MSAGAWCCAHCEKVNSLRRTPSLPTPGYLAEKAKLTVVTSAGEVDPRRLHGPDLARWQAAEARSARHPDVQRWLDAAGATPLGHGGPPAA